MVSFTFNGVADCAGMNGPSKRRARNLLEQPCANAVGAERKGWCLTSSFEHGNPHTGPCESYQRYDDHLRCVNDESTKCSHVVVYTNSLSRSK